MLRLLAEHGGSVVDSSPMYGEAERVAGDLTAELGLRDKLFFATKVWTSGREAGHPRRWSSRFRLMRTERMDLMQVHNLLDVETHAKTLREWKAAGRVRYIGITHYHSGAYRDLERLVKTKQFDFVQFNFSMAEREAEERLLPLCAETGDRGHRQPAVRRGGPLRPGQRQSLPAVGRGVRLHELGAVFPEVDTRRTRRSPASFPARAAPRT